MTPEEKEKITSLKNRENHNKLIYANNDFAVFDKGASEFYGAEDEFISDQPLEGVKWNKDLTEASFKKLPPVFSCKLPIIMDEVFNTVFHKKKMKQALQSPAHLTALIDRLVESMKTKAVIALNSKIVEIISHKDNYKDSA